MKRVLQLGLGMQGKAALYDMLKNDISAEITVVDSNHQLTEEVKKYNSTKVKAVVLDINSAQQEVVGMMKRADVVLDLLPGKYTYLVAKMALKAGTNLVSAMPFTYMTEESPLEIQKRKEDLIEVDKLAKQKNITLISELGMEPGLDHILGKKAVEEFDEVKEYYIVGAGFPELSAANNPIRYKFTWSIIDTILSYKSSAVIIKNGKVINIPGEDIYNDNYKASLQIEGLDSLLECYPCGDATRYAELLNIKDTVKNMARYYARWPGHANFWSKIVKCGFLEMEPINIRGVNISPLEFTSSLLKAQDQFYYKNQEKDVALIRADVSGIKNGKKGRVVYQILDYKDTDTGLSAMSRTTGFTAAIGTQLIVKEFDFDKGLLTPIDVPFDVMKKELERRNIFIERTYTDLK